MKLIFVILVLYASACQESSRSIPTMLQEQTTPKDNLTTQLSGFWGGTSGDGVSDSTKCYWYLDLNQSGDFKLSVSYSNTAKQDHLSGTWYVSDHLLFLLPSNSGTYLFPIAITSEDREQSGFHGYPATIREVEKDRVELFFHCVDWQGLDHLLLARRIKPQEPVANDLDYFGVEKGEKGRKRCRRWGENGAATSKRLPTPLIPRSFTSPESYR